MTSLLILPGLCTLVALRIIWARCLGARVEQAEFSVRIGGRVTVSDADRLRLATVLLAPSLTLAVIGCIVGLPLAIELVVLGVPVVPDQPTAESLGAGLVKRQAWNGSLEAVSAWIAVSCWYLSAPSFDELTRAQAALSASEEPSRGQRALASGLRAPAMIGRPLAFLSRTGLAVGVVSVIGWFLITVIITRVILG